VILMSFATPVEFASGRTLGRIVMTLDVFETGGSTTGAEIGTGRVSTGTGVGVWFSFSDSASIGWMFGVSRS
jgi:hypothetical protein